MKLLFLSNDYPNPIDPTKAVFNQRLVSALADSHTVEVVCPIAWTDEWRARWRRTVEDVPRRIDGHDGVRVHHPRYVFPPKLLRSRYDAFLWRSIHALLERVADDLQPDAVLAYWAHPDGAVAVRLARLYDIPAVVMVGGSDVLILGRGGSRSRAIRRVLQEADAVVAVSRHLADCVRRLGAADEKVHIVYRGVDTRVFCPGHRIAARQRLGLREDRPMLLCVGRLVPVKAVDTLIHACRVLRDRGHLFSCYVLGDGPQRRSLSRLVRRCGLEGIVHLCGNRSAGELADWYRAADRVVLASRSEGIPNVLLESIACGTPFVATDVGGIAEIADPQQDRLVPPGNHGAFVEAIEETLKDLCKGSLADRAFQPRSWRQSAQELVRLVGACCRAEGKHSGGAEGAQEGSLGHGDPQCERAVAVLTQSG